MALEAASILVLTLVLASICLIATSVRRRVNCTARAKPPQPHSWPLIGHLPLLSRSKQPLHRFLSSLAQTYGPIMRLQLGFRPVLVISSSDLAKECFTTNDKPFASRPPFYAGKHLGYNFKILSFAPYGPYWRSVRKICSLQLFTAHRIESFSNIRTEEISSLIRLLLESSQREINPVNIKSRLSDLTFNIIVRMVASKRFSPDLCSDDFKQVQQFREIIEETLLLAGSFDIGYYLPFLKRLDLHGRMSAMKNLQKKREGFMMRLLQEHREKREDHARDLIDVLISATDNHEIQSDNNDDVVKATALTLISAGTETSSATIEWALSSLMNHPDILYKAQQEIDTHVGREH